MAIEDEVVGTGTQITKTAKLAELLKKASSSKNIKGLAGGAFTYWLIDKLLSGYNESKMRSIQMSGLQKQSELMTPENIYTQQALPQAQTEAASAQQMLLSALGGGIIGPSLARGERRISG